MQKQALRTLSRRRRYKRLEKKSQERMLKAYPNLRDFPPESARIVADFYDWFAENKTEAVNAAYIPSLDNYTRTQIVFGGAGSGKSFSQAQRYVLRVLGGRNVLTCRAVARTIRKSVFAEIENAINEWGLRSVFSTNKSEMTITCDNGYQFIFVGLDDPEKIKSIRPAKGIIDDVWVEEATETSKKAVKQLYKRQRGRGGEHPKTITLTFNPILRSHWIFTEYFKPLAWGDTQTKHTGDGLTILKTWYIHNRFLTEQDIDDLENEGDEYYRDVYTYGNWGVLGNLILTNYKTIDCAPFRSQATQIFPGLDFGFSNDPAAFVECGLIDGDVYIFKEFYQRELSNKDIYELALPIIGDETGLPCDGAEPKSIAELRDLGLDAYAVKKGQGSLAYGIKWLKDRTIYIDESCVNAQNEFAMWQWKSDKWGEPTRIPVDANNHIIDAVRYAFEEEMSSGWVMTDYPDLDDEGDYEDWDDEDEDDYYDD